ncbi:MAG: efflux RND transporter periplasmic adaptor subunit [Flavobacteriales bacterium]
MKTKQILIAAVILFLGIIIGKFTFSSSEIKADKHTLETGEEHWTCSMHPQIDMPQPGQCPICGMDLIPKAKNSDDGIAVNSFKMSKNAMALANIETTTVGGYDSNSDKNGGFLLLSGKIATNDHTSAVQTAHFGGRIEKLYFKSKGEYVKKGALLASIYSPDLVTAQNELIETMEVKELQPELYNAVRNKLKHWKISEKQIQQIEQTKKVITNFNVYANVSGYIDFILVDEGNHVKEGTPLFKVSNLFSVWAVFDVYEQDIKKMKKGQNITIKINAYPNEEIPAKIDFIDPNLNSSTRTIAVRATLNNSNGKLKPGMFISTQVRSQNVKHNSEIVSIPKTAVLWTGKRSVVYVKTSKTEPIFELREVNLGSLTSDYYQIISGLKNGEEIVINGAFTVDAAAQLQGKKSMMNLPKYNKQTHQYRCPMDCESGKIYTKPGKCPVCKMDLTE